MPRPKRDVPRISKKDWKRINSEIDAVLARDKEFFAEVGRAIVRLSDIEDALATSCIFLSRQFDMAEAEFFNGQYSLEKKLAFFNLLIRNLNVPEITKAWDVIYADLNHHKGVRNLIAHQSML